MIFISSLEECERSEKIVGDYLFLKISRININLSIDIKIKSLLFIVLTMSALNPLAHILESNRLTKINFKDWLRNLKIVLISKNLGYILDQDPPSFAKPS